VALQAASVALGFFTILHEVDDGGVFATGYDYESNIGIMIHRYVGLGLIPLAALVLLVLSFFTRAPGAVRWAAAVFGLVVLQVALVFVAFVVAWGGALHGLNALALFLAALWTGRRIMRVSDRREVETPVAAPV
jgi:heme A synthase